MQIIENNLIKEKAYIEKLDNGFTIICIPKEHTKKKYAVCTIGYGSNYNKFITSDEKEITYVPDGVAHYLEHKMFEQPNGINSLDILSSLGVDANAYTANDHTAYLFECTNNFDEALDELLSYIQMPHFTDENVEKERGIISQEINMYDDDPEWQVYINCMKALYKQNPLKIDIAGDVESIKKIDKEILYKCYNNFYIPENMALVIVGNFKPEETIENIKKKIKLANKPKAKIIYDKEDLDINQNKIVAEMDISVPIFTLGIKINPKYSDKVKRALAIEILLEMILGNSSKVYKYLYEKGLIYDSLLSSFEWSKEEYAHILIQGKSKEIEKVKKIIIEKIEQTKEEGIKDIEFERAKRKVYGLYVKEFDDVSEEGTIFETSFIKEVSPFDYIEKYKTISKEYVIEILNECFDINKIVESCIVPRHIGEIA